jgi:integrase
MTRGNTPSAPRRDTGRHRDGKLRGIYYRVRADGSKEWSYYDPRLGRPVGGCQSRQEAIDKRAMAQLAKSAGLPAPDTKTRIADLAEEVREAKRGRLRPSTFSTFEYVLDKIILKELGHLRPTQVGPDKLAQLIRDLERRGLAPSTIRRYLSPLGAIFNLALRRGIIASSPIGLLSDDERPRGGGVGTHCEWEPREISALFSAGDELAKRSESRYDYTPLLKLLTLTGLRVSEALALRWGDVDLLEAIVNVRQSLNRDGSLGAPKTAAGERDVWLSPGLVDMLIKLKPEDAADEDFVFASRKSRRRPISYHNFRRRGFKPAVDKAGLAGKGITIHTLRSAAISLYAANGLTLEETAKVMGQKNPQVTWRHYYRLFDKSNVAERVRAAQSAITDFL